ncbi:MAG: hypothetical protein KJ950_16905 [Proteobacteria bacterium]|nr:hypothetical protein [Pseudomonadota bacterium]MBU1688162.1 hypothetical protein [Pseudomonadota bacterium]
MKKTLCLVLLTILAPGTAAFAGSCLEGDCQNGTGTFQWNNGARFTGSFINATPDGKGTYFNKDGNEYLVEYQDGRVVSSKAVSKEEIELKKRHREAMKYNQAGVLYHQKKDFESAIFFYNQAITLWPDNPEFHHNYRRAKAGER